MKTLGELQKFYQTDLSQALEKIDRDRSAILKQITIFGGIAIVSFAVLALVKLIVPAIIAAVVSLAIAAFTISPKYSAFVAEFKARIIKPVVQFMDPNLGYSSSQCVSESTFRKSGIFKRDVDRYSGDDLIRGRIGETDIEFSEVHAEYKTETRDSKGRKQTHWHTIFKGIFFSADFNKNFRGKTFVLTDVAEKSFGFLGKAMQGWNSSHGELVKLEDPEFEKEFVVYADDQTEARYILSPALMKRLLDFRRESKSSVQFSFVHSRVFVAIPIRRDLFEPSLFRSINRFEPIQEYYYDLSLALGVVEDLNLNTRIWTKE